jgi:hypothetical protein
MLIVVAVMVVIVVVVGSNMLEHNIIVDPRQVEWEVVDWIQGPVAGSYERDNEHYSSIKGREFLD